MKQGYIYRITNNINGKWYIGSRRCVDMDTARTDPYFGSGKLLKAAIKKYGKWNFTKEILCFVEDAYELEDLILITIDAAADKNCYNLKNAGEGGAVGESNPMFGKHLSDEVKIKLREFNLGRRRGADFRAKMRIINSAHIISLTHKAAISAANSGDNHGMAVEVKNDMGVVYTTAVAASKDCNVNYGNLVQCCKGKRKSAGKYPDGSKIKWSYVEKTL